MAKKDRKPSGLTPEVINHWKRQIDPETGRHYTQAKIARMYGVTPQAVSWVISHYGGVIKSPSEMIDELWPWKVPAKFHFSSPNLRLRDHLRFMETGGRGMRPDRLVLLKGFYKRLRDDDVVVEFDPNIPEEDGVAYTGGWAYRPRQKTDGDLIIRVNEYTAELSEEAKLIWGFPPDDPEVPIPAPR